MAATNTKLLLVIVADRHYQAAIADLDNAIQLNPKHVKAHRNRGYVKEKLGQQEAAEADFEKARALDSAAQTESE